MPLQAAISSDIDTLWSNYKGIGCRGAGGYTYAEFSMGLENFHAFLDRYNIRSTLFMVGHDFEQPQNHDSIKAMAQAGHEIANHTMNHPQGFRLLDAKKKAEEIVRMDRLAQEIAGVKPVGFRSPGWNVADDTVSILKRLGYRYDSSVFPTALSPLLKFLHWRSMSKRSPEDRTTMGHLHYALAPLRPIECSEKSFSKRGKSGIVEFPITVTPTLRLPLFATYVLATGWSLFERSYHALRRRGYPIQFMFHLSDFVDYQHSSLADQVPKHGDGVYIPQALNTDLQTKVDLFSRVVELIGSDYKFTRLDHWAEQIVNPKSSHDTAIQA